MAANQKPKNEDFEKALKYLDDEAQRLTDISKNLSETWKKSDREWVPMYLLEQTKEAEEKMKQIRSLILKRVPRANIEDATKDMVPGACQEHQEKIKQLEKNNETLLQINQTLAKQLCDLKKEFKKEEVPPLVQQSLQVDNQEKKPVSTFNRVPRANIEDATKDTVPGACQEHQEKIKQLEKNNEFLLQNKQLLKKALSDLKKEFISEVPPVVQSSLQVEKQEKKPVSTFKLPKGEEVLNFPENAFMKKMMDLESKINKEKADLKSENGKLSEKINALEARIQELEKDNNVLSERLSKNPGNKLVENNPAIIDLSDPNRPTKLAEYFSELYDNEWTDAFEALKTAGYDEITAINTLSLTLENALQFCEIKAELLLIKASDAVNLMFKEYQQSILDMALIMGKHLRPEQSSLDDIRLQHMWKPKTEKGSQKSRSEYMNKTEIIKVEAEYEMKTLRKKTASAMVPIVQKAYIESYCSDECIDEIKPFILKCLYLGWMMKVQSPPMVFHKCDMEARFDKNLYKEYMTSGQLVSFVIWPALLLHENGPIVCKGVAEGKKIQT